MQKLATIEAQMESLLPRYSKSGRSPEEELGKRTLELELQHRRAFWDKWRDVASEVVEEGDYTRSNPRPLLKVLGRNVRLKVTLEIEDLEDARETHPYVKMHVRRILEILDLARVAKPFWILSDFVHQIKTNFSWLEIPSGYKPNTLNRFYNRLKNDFRDQPEFQSVREFDEYAKEWAKLK